MIHSFTFSHFPSLHSILSTPKFDIDIDIDIDIDVHLNIGIPFTCNYQEWSNVIKYFYPPKYDATHTKIVDEIDLYRKFTLSSFIYSPKDLTKYPYNSRITRWVEEYSKYSSSSSSTSSSSTSCYFAISMTTFCLLLKCSRFLLLLLLLLLLLTCTLTLMLMLTITITITPTTGTHRGWRKNPSDKAMMLRMALVEKKYFTEANNTAASALGATVAQAGTGTTVGGAPTLASMTGMNMDNAFCGNGILLLRFESDVELIANPNPKYTSFHITLQYPTCRIPTPSTLTSHHLRFMTTLVK